MIFKGGGGAQSQTSTAEKGDILKVILGFQNIYDLSSEGLGEMLEGDFAMNVIYIRYFQF